MLGIVSEDENHNKIFKPMAGATLGQGVPLGAWCSFEKDVAPSSNWLMAGTTFDATKYPALNLYLGTNKVPSRYDHSRLSDLETLVADGTSNTWIDNYPNQTRTRYYEVPYDGIIIILGKNRNIGSNNVIEISNDKGNTWETIGWNYPNAGSTNTIPVKKGQYICASSSESGKFTSALGAFYKHPLFIKATSIASDTDQQAILAQIQAFNTYSTEETLTGKTWIDGKPIYRKVVIFDNATSWNRDSWGLIPNSANDVPNAEQIVSFFAFAFLYGKLAIATYGEAYAESDGIHYYSTVSISLKSYTVEYTKTTD